MTAIRECTYAEILDLVPLARKEGMRLDSGRALPWIGAFIDGKIVGVVASEVRPKKVLLRLGYTAPACRRRGIGLALRKTFMLTWPGVMLESVSLHASNLRRLGWRELGPRGRYIVMRYG